MTPKFRAYSKADNAIYKVLLIDFKSSIEQIKLKKTGEIWYDFEDIILMQSTGMFDTNGVEIFQGDVLNYGDYLNSHEVVFKEGRFWGHAIGEKENIGIGLFNALEDLEVIGNVWENEDLLNDC